MSTNEKEDQNAENSFENENGEQENDIENDDRNSLELSEVNDENQDENCITNETSKEVVHEIENENGLENDNVQIIEYSESNENVNQLSTENDTTPLNTEEKPGDFVNTENEMEETVDSSQNCETFENGNFNGMQEISKTEPNFEENEESHDNLNIIENNACLNTVDSEINGGFSAEKNVHDNTPEFEKKIDSVDICDSQISDPFNVQNVHLNYEENENTINNHESPSKEPDVKCPTSNVENENNTICCMCDKVVYSMEKLTTNDRVFHKTCFRCSKCKNALSSGNFTFNNGKPYCTTHYMEMFKKRGRYDEADYDNMETEIPTSTDVNDLMTDELPAPDTTKNMLAKFRDLQAGIGQNVNQSTVTESSDEMPAPNTTKMLMEHFKTIGQDKPEPKCKPKIEIHSVSNGHSNGTYENEPVILPDDVVRSNDPGQDDRPDQGFTKNLLNRFRELESSTNN